MGIGNLTVNSRDFRRKPLDKLTAPSCVEGQTPACGMETASKAARPKRCSRPSLHVFLAPAPGAPSRHGRLMQKSIERLLSRAWRAASGGRRACGARRLGVDVLVVGDRRIAKLNAKHLKHTGPTDVLSFPSGAFDPERRLFLLGEVVVSGQTARREAAARGLPYEEELARYILHGFLHLLGYEDGTAARAKEMHKIQEHILQEFSHAFVVKGSNAE